MSFGRRSSDLHPDCEVFAPLLGTWSGTGHASYPDNASADYEITITFSTNGLRFVTFVETTTNAETGAPMHSESGFWRPVPPDRVEAVIAHPGGLAEVSEGIVDGGHFQLSSVAVARTTTAKQVDVIERTYRVQDDRLTATVHMAATGHPLTPHLEEHLVRQS